MNKSYSKIRSIQNTNLLLEQRYLDEKKQLTKLILEHTLNPHLTGQEFDGKPTTITSYWDEWQRDNGDGNIEVNMRIGTEASGNGKLWFNCKSGAFRWDEVPPKKSLYKGKTHINQQLADVLKNRGLCIMQRNMANYTGQPSRYWDALIQQLKNFGFAGIKNNDKAAWIGKLVISRDKMEIGGLAAKFGVDQGRKIIAEINGIKAFLTGKPYAGQTLDKVGIESSGTDGTVTLAAWLDTYAKQYKTAATTGTTTEKPKDVGGGGKTGGGKTGIVYKECTGTYKKGCKSETIRKVQGCLGLSPDGKFGSGTEGAIFKKLNKKEFTDADVAALCAGKSTGGGATPPVGGETQGGTTQVELPEF